MPKPKRIHEPGLRHFVTFSTYKRRTYLNPDRARDIVIEVLQKTLSTHHAACSGFVIMPDHVHATLFGEESFNVSRFVQVWKKTSSYRIREFYEKEFPHYQAGRPPGDAIWQPGLYDSVIGSDKDHSAKLDYMHHNPVEAKLSDVHVAWRWSTARFYDLGESVGVTITF